MRCRPIIRTLVVYGLLGAVASVLSSWAIHTIKFWPRRAGPHPLAWRSHFRSPIDAFDRLWSYQLEWPEYRNSTDVDIEPVSFEGDSAMGWRLARGGALIRRRGPRRLADDVRRGGSARIWLAHARRAGGERLVPRPAQRRDSS